MAITMRKGLRADFKPDRMLPGEWAVCTDPETLNQVVYMCFRAGIVKRMGTYEDFESWFDVHIAPYQAIFEGIRQDCERYRNEVVIINDTLVNTYLPQIQQYALDAENYKDDAETAAGIAETYKDDAEKAKNEAENIKQLVDDAVDRAIPEIVMNFATGCLEYTGSVFNFWIDNADGLMKWNLT